jgi:hypothetical protein
MAMRPRPVRSLEVLTISALDLFASALGVFVLMAVLLFPFYLKQPSIEADMANARENLADASAALSESRRFAEEAAERQARSQARLDRAIAEYREAEAESAAAERAVADAKSRADRVEKSKATAAEQLASISIPDLDLVFVMDATGSMRDEIADVQRSLLSIIRVLDRLAPTLHMGFVAFKDRGDEYVTSAFPLRAMDAASLQQLQAFVRTLRAQGGGDTPEPVGEALGRAVEMSWRRGSMGRILVIGDAQAHAYDWERALRLATGFHGSAPRGSRDRRVSVIFTGSNTPGRDFYGRLAMAGGGDFITHRGRMIESVLLSILQSSGSAAALAGPG